ncbi:heme ABC transporter permease [Sphingorhabdus pulchriflava]|uniref:Heme exporter protein C n=1 Tax=Sphingorhabdus pulchriflava TaxID=2292257 RepID=A0A371BHP2_9SPHN|nr:heme ABC transporter permease CcmC [Sphingorhabdus pulchriflava]MBK7163318.1 cytochrome c biogenesis protein CcsA [Sphingomonadales bacterium]RDV07105.1 heme ABC transporter permease [Sphingorhabdus pulchriflava]
MHRFANPARFLGIAKPLTPFLLWSGAILVVFSCWWGLTQVPAERLQGDTVKIMFVHVPAAWLGMAGWTGIAVASIVQLVWRHPLAGVSARAVAAPGAVFAALCLVTGSIWGKPTWGAWWVWDGRLTSMLILFFLYLGFIALANASSEKGSLSRTAAVFGIIGAVNIPIINRSVVWWESQHQKASITLGGSSIDDSYLWPLFGSAIGFSLLFGAIVLMRMRAALAEIRIEARMRRLAED